MLSTSIQIHPGKVSAQGCVRYCADSSFDALEVHYSGSELCISVLSKKEVLPQVCIKTPERLFKPFFSSTAAKEQLLPTCIEHYQPVDTASDCIATQLISKFSALTTNEEGTDCPPETKIENLNIKTQMNLSERPKDRSTAMIETQLVSVFPALSITDRDLRQTETDTQTSCPKEQKNGSFAELFFCLEVSNTGLLGSVVGESCSHPTVKKFLLERINPGVQLHILCAECEGIFTMDTFRFERVEECCEGLNSELSDSWFCHAESASVSVTVPQSLYFDSACFYLHDMVKSKLTLQTLGDGQYVCGKCGSSLTSGSKPVQGFTQFFCDKIQFQCSEPADLSYQFTMAWLTLWGFIKSALETSAICKLYLHSKGCKGDVCLLLSVLPDEVPWFFLQTVNSTKTDFKTVKVYQVSYLVSTPSSKSVRTWRYDFDVDFYKVSDTAMSVIVQYLSNASAYICTKKTEDGFRSAFLPSSFPGTQVFN